MSDKTVITMLTGSFIALLGTIVGGFLSHFLSSTRDKNNDMKERLRETFSLLNVISFSLIMQYSQLCNLKMNLNNRLSIINDMTRLQKRDDRVQALQDIPLDTAIIIKIDWISELLGLVVNCFPKYSVNLDIFNSCYWANKMYHETIESVKKYNALKQALNSDESSVDLMIDFLRINIPSYLEILEKRMPFLKRTQDSLAELFCLLEKKPLQIDRPIEIFGTKSS